MMDVANLKPSDIEELAEHGVSRTMRDAILDGLRRLLREVRPDQGADSDRIHMTASLLAMGGVWERIDPKELAIAMAHTNELNIKDFLEGLPARYSREVAYHLATTAVSLQLTNQGRLVDSVAASRAYAFLDEGVEIGFDIDVAAESALDSGWSSSTGITWHLQSRHAMEDVAKSTLRPPESPRKSRKTSKSLP